MSNAIELRGDTALINALQRFPERAERELRGVSDRALLSGVAFLKYYPPLEPHQRKFILRKFWTSAKPSFQRIGGGFLGTIGNPVAYAPFVQSAERQAWFHKARGWRTDAQAIDEIVKPTAEREMQAAARRLVNLT